LALFALAMQIVLSFGHVHYYALGLASADAAPATAQESGAALPSAPAPIHKSDGSVGLDCAICALIQLWAISAPGAAPALPLPVKVGANGLHVSLASASAASPHFLFQARAPPSN
jgi:hypothetical protein